ncbi:MAG TPA: hypothetical protein VJN18_12480 [Polyangiaceae bacterium]|nr:hypothetical protein [Polyangiaceae bacterium]
MSQDFEELLGWLNARKVRYLIGGAHALAYHARPRATKDLDLFVAPTRANAERFIEALSDFFGGPPPSYVSVETLLDANLIVQLGVAPVRVDVLSHFGTLTFAEAWRTRVDARFGSVDAHYLGRDQLIAEKIFFDRPQDRADVAVLRAKASRAGRTSPKKPRSRRRS